MGDPSFELSFWEESDPKKQMQKILDGVTTEKEFFATVSAIDAMDVENKVFLDLGCGLGRVARRIVGKKAKQYIGMDFSKSMIARATSLHLDLPVKFIVNDGMKIPLPDNSVDMVNAELIFLHCWKPVQILYFQEIHRVLAPGGLMVAQVPHVKKSPENGFAFFELREALKYFQLNVVIINHYLDTRSTK
jgi:ubiquinone/menaquinone biosynthesis C-methylase UbiE